MRHARTPRAHVCVRRVQIDLGRQVQRLRGTERLLRAEGRYRQQPVPADRLLVLDHPQHQPLLVSPLARPGSPVHGRLFVAAEPRPVRREMTPDEMAALPHALDRLETLDPDQRLRVVPQPTEQADDCIHVLEPLPFLEMLEREDDIYQLRTFEALGDHRAPDEHAVRLEVAVRPEDLQVLWP